VLFRSLTVFGESQTSACDRPMTGFDPYQTRRFAIRSVMTIEPYTIALREVRAN
jgi:hypothetical protein